MPIAFPVDWPTVPRFPFLTWELIGAFVGTGRLMNSRNASSYRAVCDRTLRSARAYCDVITERNSCRGLIPPTNT